MEHIKARTYDFDKVKVLSKKQLNSHYKLYEGYVKTINEIWDNLSKGESYEKPNATYSELRSLMLGQSFSLDGVKLHEMYFENICEDNSKPYGSALSLVIDRYNNYENFIKVLIAVGMSVRGWIIFGIDKRSGNPCIFGSDAHDVGAIWNAHPLIVIDVYEHAYMIDFGIDKKEYLENITKNINWHVVNKRLEKFK